MPRGAAQGERRGGRSKGTPNRKTVEQFTAITETGSTPLQYLVSVYRDDSVQLGQRVEAAKAAAPYVHARLSSIDLSVDGEIRTVDVSDEPLTVDEWTAMYCVDQSEGRTQ